MRSKDFVHTFWGVEYQEIILVLCEVLIIRQLYKS